MANLNVECSEELKAAIRLAAKQEDSNVSQLGRRLFGKYLRKKGKMKGDEIDPDFLKQALLFQQQKKTTAGE